MVQALRGRRGGGDGDSNDGGGGGLGGGGGGLGDGAVGDINDGGGGGGGGGGLGGGGDGGGGGGGGLCFLGWRLCVGLLPVGLLVRVRLPGSLLEDRVRHVARRADHMVHPLGLVRARVRARVRGLG